MECIAGINCKNKKDHLRPTKLKGVSPGSSGQDLLCCYCRKISKDPIKKAVVVTTEAHESAPNQRIILDNDASDIIPTIISAAPSPAVTAAPCLGEAHSTSEVGPPEVMPSSSSNKTSDSLKFEWVDTFASGEKEKINKDVSSLLGEKLRPAGEALGKSSGDAPASGSPRKDSEEYLAEASSVEDKFKQNPERLSSLDHWLSDYQTKIHNKYEKFKKENEETPRYRDALARALEYVQIKDVDQVKYMEQLKKNLMLFIFNEKVAEKYRSDIKQIITRQDPRTISLMVSASLYEGRNRLERLWNNHFNVDSRAVGSSLVNKYAREASYSCLLKFNKNIETLTASAVWAEGAGGGEGEGTGANKAETKNQNNMGKSYQIVIYANPAFISILDDESIARAVAHEYLHHVRGHGFRKIALVNDIMTSWTQKTGLPISAAEKEQLIDIANMAYDIDVNESLGINSLKLRLDSKEKDYLRQLFAVAAIEGGEAKFTMGEDEKLYIKLFSRARLKDLPSNIENPEDLFDYIISKSQK
jgi:hypothetical protein